LQPLDTNNPNTTKVRWPLPVYALFAYMAAITVFGKGPTYLGFPPLYWGELTMLVGGFWMLLPSSRPQVATSLPRTLGALIVAFMCQGGLQLVAEVLTGQDTKMAIRDSAIWYYCVFFFFGLALARRPANADLFWNRMQWAWLFALLWHLGNFITQNWPILHSPLVPGRGVRVLSNSGSEAQQHVFLAAVLIILAPHLASRLRGRWIWLAMSFLGALRVLVSWGRATKLAALAALLVAIVTSFGGAPRVWPAGQLPLAIFIPTIAALGAVLVLPYEQLYAKAGLNRFENMLDEKRGTTYWRRIWWNNIHEAVWGESPMLGLGFGESLGKYNPHIQGDELAGPWAIRSPHNINITVYARMGILGSTLWLVMLIAGLGRLALFVRTSKNRWGQFTSERRKELTFWLMMLTASWINSSFGLLMEGPVLGVWYWFAMGFAQGRARTADGTVPTA